MGEISGWEKSASFADDVQGDIDRHDTFIHSLGEGYDNDDNDSGDDLTRGRLSAEMIRMRRATTVGTMGFTSSQRG